MQAEPPNMEGEPANNNELQYIKRNNDKTNKV